MTWAMFGWESIREFQGFWLDQEGDNLGREQCQITNVLPRKRYGVSMKSLEYSSIEDFNPVEILFCLFPLVYFYSI